FRRLGARVTVVQRGERLLGREDPDIADEGLKILLEDGLEVLLSTSMVGLANGANGLALTVSCDGSERVIEGSHRLNATGRTPNTELLNMAATGLTANERGEIPVNDKLETAVAGIYALGDVKGGPAFTHISYDDYRILRGNLLQGQNLTTRGR